MVRLTLTQLASKQQLTDLANTPLDARVGAYQDSIYSARNIMAEYHLQGGKAETIARIYSQFMDKILTHIWQFIISPQNSSSLIAAGGYGRHELNLESDIDFVILTTEKQAEKYRAEFEYFVQFCWDIGLKCGHHIGSQQQFIALAKDDITVMTNLLETRVITGGEKAFEQLQKRLRSKTIWPPKAFFAAKLQEQEQRHLRHADTANNLEPNLKESPGGLRDLHMISWVANRYFGTSNPEELVQHAFLTENEYKALIQGRNYIWRLRNGLHILAGRDENRLLFNYQRELAKQLGFKDNANHLAVEQMMQAYYRTVKQLELLNEILLQHFRLAILKEGNHNKHIIDKDFYSIDDYLHCRKDELFSLAPAKILHAFLRLQQNPSLKGMSPSMIRQIRKNLTALNKKRRSADVRSAFLQIFCVQQGLTHALRSMNRYGVLGAVFPEFERVIGQMQHDMFHVYTVDEHCLFVVRNLRRLMLDKHRDELPLLREIMANLAQRERLFIAALCHDIGKGSGRDHSIVGEEISAKLCQDLGMSDYDSQFVAWLVRHHLTMSWTAQREDTSDPKVIDKFCKIVGDQQHLDNLYLLTVADMRGTSDKVWNEWKGQLLQHLYISASRRLRTGFDDAQTTGKLIESHQNAISVLLKESLSKDQLHTLYEQIDPDYFLRNSPESSAWQLQQISRASLLDLPLLKIRYREEVKALQILLVAPESEKFLPSITGALEKMQHSILDARIHPMQSGLVIAIFTTHTPNINDIDEVDLTQLTVEITQLMRRPIEKSSPTARLLPRAMREFQVKTNVSFAENVSGITTMEVVSQDRPGLLFNVARAMIECKVKLKSAKISTVGERAEDTFFITDRDGQPIRDTRQQQQLADLIVQYLS